MTIKKILIIIGAVAAITILSLGVYHSDASQQTNLLSEKEISDLVSSQYPGEITRMELNQDSNQSIYEVTIKGDQAEYELLMDADSGKVLKLKETRSIASDQSTDKGKQEAGTKKKEQNQDTKKAADKKQSNSETNDKKDQQTNNAKDKNSETGQTDSNKSSQASNDESSENQASKKQNEKPEKEKKTAISRDEAVKIALGQFSGNVEDVDLEEENGQLIYEIEIERGDKEAEIIIDAYTGEVLVMEIDD